LANGDSLRHPAVRHCPVVISTAEKVKLFHYWIARDKANYQPDVPSPEDAVMVRVARNRLLRDAYSSWGHGGSDLKKQVKVEFVSADGIPEAGIDGGGLFRELVSKYALGNAVCEKLIFNCRSFSCIELSLKDFLRTLGYLRPLPKILFILDRMHP
jgi:ubiquitin-protein ligase E3 C